MDAKVTLSGWSSHKKKPSGFVYISGIFTPEECGDIWEFGVHPILLNSLKYSSPKILYHDGEFLI
jgi:hypothetical protein